MSTTNYHRRLLGLRRIASEGDGAISFPEKSNHAIERSRPRSVAHATVSDPAWPSLEPHPPLNLRLYCYG
jgi:hypothetical protein